MTLPLARSYAPMEALLVAELPVGAEWQYEPKWDGFRCLAFRAVILAEICARPVVVVLSVGFIVLLSIAHEILQREAIVTRDEIDAALGAFTRRGIDVGTAADAAGKQTGGR